MYYIYSKVTVVDYTDSGHDAKFNPDLIHILGRNNPLYPGGSDEIIKVAKTKTLTAGGHYSENESTVGGVFRLFKGDELVVRIKGDYDLSHIAEASYLGLLKLK